MLERTSTADLGYLAGIADPQGECVVCQHPLGDQPWAAVVDTAAGPRGAWSAEGGYAHPSCAPEQDVNMLLDGRLSYFAAAGRRRVDASKRPGDTRQDAGSHEM